jgi:hypothetical protein
MANTVTIKILELNTETRVCVAEVTDSNTVIFTGNFGIDELNPDGTANTVWITNKVKEFVIGHRDYAKKERSLELLKTTINSQGV